MLESVPDRGPVAAFTATATPAGTPTAFDASASYARSSAIAHYHWNFGDGSAVVTSVPTTTHTYADPGTYAVRLTVYDAAGTSAHFVFTGQTASRFGGDRARIKHLVEIGT